MIIMMIKLNVQEPTRTVISASLMRRAIAQQFGIVLAAAATLPIYGAIIQAVLGVMTTIGLEEMRTTGATLLQTAGIREARE